MSHTKIATAILFILLQSCSLTFGQHVADGNALLRNCSVGIKANSQGAVSATDAFYSGECVGLVRGIANIMTIWAALDRVERVNTGAVHGCVPDGVNPTHLVRIVVRYLNSHPAQLNQPDSLLVIRALANAYPCKPAH